MPLPKPVFLSSTGEVLMTSDDLLWTVEAIVFALYFVKRSPWCWFLFNRPIRH